MRNFAFAIALFGAGFGFSQMGAAESLTMDDCRPLTQDNARECCAADNWKNLVPSSERAICDRSDIDANITGSLTEPNGNLPGSPDPPDQAATIGNPGNEPAINGPDKEVGHAGENPPSDGGGGFGDSEAHGNSQ
jgi:hypothetical protein